VTAREPTIPPAPVEIEPGRVGAPWVVLGCLVVLGILVAAIHVAAEPSRAGPLPSAAAQVPAPALAPLADTMVVPLRVLTPDARERWRERCQAGGDRPVVTASRVICWAAYADPEDDVVMWEVTADGLAELERL